MHIIGCIKQLQNHFSKALFFFPNQVTLQRQFGKNQHQFSSTAKGKHQAPSRIGGPHFCQILQKATNIYQDHCTRKKQPLKSFVFILSLGILSPFHQNLITTIICFKCETYFLKVLHNLHETSQFWGNHLESMYKHSEKRAVRKLRGDECLIKLTKLLTSVYSPVRVKNYFREKKLLEFRCKFTSQLILCLFSIPKCYLHTSLFGSCVLASYCFQSPLPISKPFY